MINLKLTGLCHGLGTNQVDNQLSASTARRRSKKQTTFFHFLFFFRLLRSILLLLLSFFSFFFFLFIMKVGAVDWTPSGFESWPGLYVVFLGTTIHAHKRSLHKSL